MSKYDCMDVYFHRLAPGSPSDDVLNYFYQEGYILCHYENTASFSEDDYDGDAADLEDIVQFAEDGGICLIQLDADNDYYARGRKIGVVSPHTSPIIVGVRADGSRTQNFTNPERAAVELENNPDIDYIYKGVQITDEIRELPSERYRLSAYEPPSTTFSNWYVVDDQIRAFLSDEDLPIDEPTSYSPDQIELLCAEYLREQKDYYPLMEAGGPGGIGESFDLRGGIKEDWVFGEVKNTKGISDSALSNLEEETGDGRCAFYFSRKPVENDRDGVEVILLEDVLALLKDDDRTRRMMKRMTEW